MNKLFISALMRRPSSNNIYLTSWLRNGQSGQVPALRYSTTSSETSNPTRATRVSEADQFGIGGQYAELDSVKSMRFEIKPDRRAGQKPANKAQKPPSAVAATDPRQSQHRFKERQPVTPQPQAALDPADTFGTLTNECNDLVFKASITSNKPLSDSEFLAPKKKASHRAEKETVNGDEPQIAIVQHKNANKRDDDDNDENDFEKKYDSILNHIPLKNGDEHPNHENYYAAHMRRLGAKGKIKEAIDCFYEEMIAKDRFKPTLFVYCTLMQILAKAGYTHMVFVLFKRLRRSKAEEWTKVPNKRTMHQIVTLLFQACAKCEWPEYAIRKTDAIRFYLKDRGIVPNELNYAAMIQSYGRANAIYEAFNVVDEMLAHKLKPDVDTFNNLLCACIGQADYGFKYALFVWQMCLKYKVQPDLTTYNLLLRATRECCVERDRPARSKHTAGERQGRTLFEKQRQGETAALGLAAQADAAVDDDEYDELVRARTDATVFGTTQPTQQQRPTPQQQMRQISDKYKLTAATTTTTSINSDETLEVIELKPEDVHVIDEMQVIGTSLQKQIDELEWWQDASKHVDKASVLDELAKVKPDLRAKIDSIKSKRVDSLLTRHGVDVDEAVRAVYKTRHDDNAPTRLRIVGDLDGLFAAMRTHGVQPDIRTFNMLIEMIPDEIEAEQKLMDAMREFKVEMDIDFVNFLIRRRINRRDEESAQQAFKLIQMHQLKPNVATFGCLAYKVTNTKLFDEFVNDVHAMGFELNKFMVPTLYGRALHRLNLDMITRVLNYAAEKRVHMSPDFVDRVKTDLDKLRVKIIEFEKKSVNAMSEREKEYYKRMSTFHFEFKSYFNEWPKRAKFETREHPYKRFAGGAEDRLYQKFVRITADYEKPTTPTLK